MSKEQYVSYEIAKLIKDKGFRGDCIAYYNDDGKRYLSLNAELHPLPCPTQAVACSWLREEHEIDIIPVIRHSLKYAQESPFRDYACRVYDCDGNIVLSATKWYSRYENAVEAALEYTLKNLI